MGRAWAVAALVGAALLLSSAASHAQLGNGNYIDDGGDLLATCEGAEMDMAKCVSFIRGVATAFHMGRMMAGGKDRLFCLSGDVRTFELWSPVRDYLKEDAARLRQGAEQAVVSALVARYPCR